MLKKFKTHILSKHRAKEKNKTSSFARKLFLALGFLILATIIGVFLFLFWIIKDLPNISKIDEIIFAESSIIYDRNGVELYTIHGDENRKIVPINTIPDSLIQATISIEDAAFFEHAGFSLKGIVKAVFSELVNFGAHKRGGSTLTQQFIKNTFLNSEKTYTRKIKELILSLQLEWRYEKDEILGMYLNSIPYGSNAFGVEQASLTFFGKPVKELGLEESIILAALPNAPSYYSPYGAHIHSSLPFLDDEIKELPLYSYKELLSEVGESSIVFGLLPKQIDMNNGASIVIPGRTTLVLNRMEELGYILKEERDLSEKKLANFSFQKYRIEIKAPHFVMYVRDILEEEFGKEFINAGGLKIHTTLDYELQQKAEKIVADQAQKNEGRYGAKNASAMAVSPETGEILAMVGSRDYWDEENDGNVNIMIQRRLAGSSFKPFAYASAFLSGYAPATVAFDTETDFGNGYTPQNYDGKFRGPVSMRNALGNSLNIPAVKAGILGGLQQTYDLSKSMGIKFLKDADWYGSALSLGVAEVRPIDMAEAYSVFANMGKHVELTPFLRVIDKNNNILLKKEEESLVQENVLDPGIAYLISDVLSDPDARGPGWNSMLQVPGHINAAKTGTSNKKKNKDEIWPLDGWTIGYTPDVLVVAWAGNNNGSVMKRNGSGFSVAGPIFKNLMVEALAEKSLKKFTKPQGVKTALVSKLTGKLPSSEFPQDLIVPELFASKNLPRTYDNSLRVIEVEKISGDLPNEYTPKEALKSASVIQWKSLMTQNPDWEKSVQDWVKNSSEEYVASLGIENVLSAAPEKTETIHTKENTSEKPEISIVSPIANGEVSPQGVGVIPNIKSKHGVSLVEYYLDGELSHSTKDYPYKGNILFTGASIGETYTILVKVSDTLYNSASSSVEVVVAEDNQPPRLEIVSPENMASFPASSHISVQADAYDLRGNIEKVEFFLNEEKFETLRLSPYNASLNLPSEVGDYSVVVKAYDNSRNVSESQVDIRVTSKKIGRKIEVFVPSQASFGESVVLDFSLPIKDLAEIKKAELIARLSGITKQEKSLLSLSDFPEKSSGIYSHLWQRPEIADWSVFLKVSYKSGKVLFSSKQKIKIQE